MTISRYTRAPVISGGTQYGTSQATLILKRAVDAGLITVTERILAGSQRLDTLAGFIYGDSGNWWIIAAASGIGWGLQVPAGTRLLVPTDLAQVADLVG